MFSKLLFVSFVVSLGALQSLAQSLPEGTYHIFSEGCFPTQLRSYNTGADIFVSLTREYPGPNGEWEVGPYTNGANTIKNVGLDAFTLVKTKTQGVAVITNSNQSTTWAITPAGEDMFTIGVANQDLLWTPECSAKSNIPLRPADGSSEQLWRFIRIDE